MCTLRHPLLHRGDKVVFIPRLLCRALPDCAAACSSSRSRHSSSTILCARVPQRPARARCPVFRARRGRASISSPRPHGAALTGSAPAWLRAGGRVCCAFHGGHAAAALARGRTFAGASRRDARVARRTGLQHCNCNDDDQMPTSVGRGGLLFEVRALTPCSASSVRQRAHLLRLRARDAHSLEPCPGAAMSGRQRERTRCASGRLSDGTAPVLPFRI